jgi:hypothetical protein
MGTSCFWKQFFMSLKPEVVSNKCFIDYFSISYSTVICGYAWWRTTLLFATVPNSRINSWESLFILTCGENKQINHTETTNESYGNTCILIFFLLFPNESQHHSLYTFYTYLSGCPLQHLANMSILAFSSG